MAMYHFQKVEKSAYKKRRDKCNDFCDFSFCKHLFNTIPPPLLPPASFPWSPNRSSWTWGITSTPGHAWQLQCLFRMSSARNQKSWKSLATSHKESTFQKFHVHIYDYSSLTLVQLWAYSEAVARPSQSCHSLGYHCISKQLEDTGRPREQSWGLHAADLSPQHCTKPCTVIQYLMHQRDKCQHRRSRKPPVSTKNRLLEIAHKLGKLTAAAL